MENKSYTILIASNQQGETFKLNISNRLFRFLIVLGFLAIVLVMTVAYDYFGLLLKANENRFLKVENSTLKSQFQSAEERLSSLEASLERIQTFTKKLNLITNTEDDERVLKLGLSPSSHNAGNVADAQAAVSRLPSSEFMIRDPQNLDKPFVDEKSGEMGVARESARDYATLSVRIDRDLRQSQMREQGVLQLWGALSERQGLLNSTPSIKPTRGWSTSRFGYRTDPFTNRPEMHSGLDLAAPPGTPVYAPADGVVSYVGFEPGLGKLVTIDHGFGVTTRYGHSSKVFVEQGQKVHRWDVISAVGNSGRATGPLLYYEVRVHGVPVDPANYILAE
jgi:murein DD-endopeptidase MepM/ murein hydrolase activator NlpD